MGHLVNPVGFRLGWQRQWIDVVYEHPRFYPELIHRLLRFRFFLNCFFRPVGPSSERLLYKYYLVSHFRFSIGPQGFFIRIFYYNSRIDVSWYEFFDQISSDHTFSLRFFPKRPTERPPFSSWNRRCLALIGAIYHWFAAEDSTDGDFNYRVPLFRAFENSFSSFESGTNLLSNLASEGAPWRASDVLLLRTLDLVRFYTVLGRHGVIRERRFKRKNIGLTNFENVAHIFFRFFFFYMFTRPYLSLMGQWLRLLGTSIFGVPSPVTVFFLNVNNDQISARFLAHFLAIRLKQGFQLKTLVSPIRRDLRYSQRLAFKSHYFHRKSASDKFLVSSGPWVDLNSFIDAANVHFDGEFARRLTFWCFDSFFFAFSGIRSGPASLYTSLRFIQDKRIILFLLAGSTSWAKKFMFFGSDVSTFSREYANICFCNYETSKRLYFQKPFDTFRYSFRVPLLLVLGNALWDFLSFRPRGLTRRVSLPADRPGLRSFSPPAYGLRGFRIQLHGRFSRKQIASAFTFQEGPMPLSTIDASIDYGFATIPLRNSAIGVKVWFYRQGFIKRESLINDVRIP